MDPFTSARDCAQSAVTAILNDNRDLAAQLVNDFTGHDVALAVTALDLCARTHQAWARALCMDADSARESWAQLMLDLELARTDNR